MKVRFAAALAIGLAAAPAWSADGPFHDKPASPRSLPGDKLPPFGMLGADGRLVPEPRLPPGGVHRGPGAPPESTAAGPGLEAAVRAARAAVASCRRQGFHVGATVVDSAGEARAMLTADGSDGSHVFVAMRKAIAALAFSRPSSEARDALARDPALLSRVTPAMFVEGGAVPLYRHGRLIGAIGVSGAAGQPIGRQDEACATAGRDALYGRP